MSYVEIEKRINNYVIKNKKRQHEQLKKRLAKGHYKMVQHNNTIPDEHSSRDGDNRAKSPDLTTFPKHMHTPSEGRWAPIGKAWEKLFLRAVAGPPQNKSSGVNEVFVKAQNIDSSSSSEIICIW